MVKKSKKSKDEKQEILEQEVSDLLEQKILEQRALDILEEDTGIRYASCFDYVIKTQVLKEVRTEKQKRVARAIEAQIRRKELALTYFELMKIREIIENAYEIEMGGINPRFPRSWKPRRGGGGGALSGGH